MSIVGYWVKTGYLSLMSSYFLGPGSDAMNQCLADAIRQNDADTIDILTRLGATPDKRAIKNAIQSGSIQTLKTLCTSSSDIKEKVVAEIQSSGKVALLKNLNLFTNAKTPSTQSMFKHPSEPAAGSQLAKPSEQAQSESDDHKPMI